MDGMSPISTSCSNIDDDVVGITCMAVRMSCQHPSSENRLVLGEMDDM